MRLFVDVRHPGVILFQSTHPRGVRLSHPLAKMIHAIFQSTHPRGVRPSMIGLCHMGIPNFNPRTREGCDTPKAMPFPVNFIFQSTHPRGVRHYIDGEIIYKKVFQSTHPRGVRQGDPLHHNLHIRFQSTHPRGVRQVLTQITRVFPRFQSTHPRGVRRTRTITADGSQRFQSTHPRGVRLCIEGALFSTLPISIHAPARGATCPPSLMSAARWQFQSTHPRGVRRHNLPSRGGEYQYFNPRTREGCDDRLPDLIEQPRPISIHAPARGATRPSGWLPHRLHNFNPRTREGCDTSSIDSDTYNKVFQSTHPRGVRPL